MTQCFKDDSRIIVPPVYVTMAPSLFHHMRPHPMPVYNHSTSEKCAYACNPYEKHKCYKFK